MHRQSGCVHLKIAVQMLPEGREGGMKGGRQEEELLSSVSLSFSDDALF